MQYGMVRFDLANSAIRLFSFDVFCSSLFYALLLEVVLGTLAVIVEKFARQ